jgi:hypothetical protein
MAFPVFDKKEDIPKGFEDDYEEREGKFHPKVPDVTKLNSALDGERTKAEKEEKERKRLERENADLKRKQTAADNNISDEALDKLRKEDAEKRKPIEEENARLKLELVKVKKSDRVKSLALQHGIMSDRIDDAMDQLDKRTGLTENGETITVLDKTGKLTTESIEEFLKTTFKKEKPWLYKGSGASGSGAGGSSGGTDDDEEEEIQPTKADTARVVGAF